MGCEKVIVPLNLITESCCCQGQHNQAFVLIVNASLLCGGILVHSSLQNCFNSERSREFEYEHPVLSHSKASKSHVSPNFDRASSSFCLSLSEVDSLMCFGSLFYCITHVSLRFRTQTDGWTFSFRMFWYIKQTSWFHQLQQNVLKQQSSPRPSQYHHHVWLLVWWSVYEILCYTTRNRTQTLQKVCLVSPQNTFSKVLFFGKCETTLYVQWFSLWNFPPVSFWLLNDAVL